MNRPTAVITGAGTGIGTAITERLAETHNLILSHLSDNDALASVADRARQAGAKVHPVPGDLTSSAVIGTLGQAIDATTTARVLVCNAGAYPRVPLADAWTGQMQASLALNLLAHLACIRLITPSMINLQFGRIVVISSVLTQAGRVDLLPYITAKGGLEAAVHALARELGPHGITVNTVRPGSIDVAAEYDLVADHAAMVRRQLARQCVQRRGTPHDVAAAVSFLASPEAGFITGQSLNVDGGWMLT